MTAKKLVMRQRWVFLLTAMVIGAAALGSESMDQNATPTGPSDPLVFDWRSWFIEQTGATVTSIPFSSSGTFTGSLQQGPVTYSASDGSSLTLIDGPSDFPDDEDIELTVEGRQNLNIRLEGIAVRAMGLDFDGRNTPEGSEAVLNFVALNDSTEVGRLTVPVPTSPVTFIGFWSEEPFNRIEIRDTGPVGAIAYFGSVLTGDAALPRGPHKFVPDSEVPGVKFLTPFDLEAGRAMVADPVGDDILIFDQGADGAWREDGRLERPDREGRFGFARALSGEVAFIGMPGPDFGTLPGAAYFYERLPDGAWAITSQLESDRVFFGSQLALDGQSAVIRHAASEAWVYERLGDGQWIYAASLTPEVSGRITREDVSIDAVFMDEATVVLSIGRDGSQVFQEDAVYVFQRQPDGSWIQEAQLTAPTWEVFDRFGEHVAVKDGMVVASLGQNSFNDGDGSGHVFERRDDGSWSYSAKLLGGNGGDFPTAISISGDWVYLGSHAGGVAPSPSLGTLAYVRRFPGVWRFVEALRPADVNPFIADVDNIAAMGNRVVVNYAFASAGTPRSGAAYEFKVFRFASGFEGNEP